MKTKLLLFLLLLTFSIRAQFKQDSTKRVHFFGIPIVIRTPETSWAFGLSGTATFKTTQRNDSTTRTSSIQVHGLYSLRKQNIEGIDGTIYFPHEKYILQVNGSHSYFPDRFWGIGQDTKNENMEEYSFEQISLTPHVKRKIKGGFFIGALLEYQYLLNIKYEENGFFDSLSPIGHDRYHIFGYGVSASYDTRNSAFWPTKGLLVQSQFLSYNNHLGSSYTFSKWVTDIRYYQRIFKQHILAAQFYNYSTFGNTPYRSLGMLGGSDNMRGYYQGRFVDQSMLSAIVEYRLPIYWRFSAVVFGGAGEVYHNAQDLSLKEMHFSFGGGIRFALNEKEKLNMRIDYGYSDNYNKGFYFTIAEAF